MEQDMSLRETQVTQRENEIESRPKRVSRYSVVYANSAAYTVLIAISGLSDISIYDFQLEL